MSDLLARYRQRFALLFDDHAITWRCRGCGEALRFTHAATIEVMDGEMRAHGCSTNTGEEQ